MQKITIAFLALIAALMSFASESTARDSVNAASGSSAASTNQSGNTKKATVVTNSQSSKQTKAMIEQLNTAIKDDPKNSNYYYRRANLYQQQGDYHRALSDFTDAIRVDPMNAQFYLARARLYSDHGDTVLAAADEKQARFVDPKLPASPSTGRGRGKYRAPGARRRLNRAMRAASQP